MTTFLEASTPTTLADFRAQALATLAAPPAPLEPAPVAGWSNRAPQRLLVEDFATDMATESKIRAGVASCISPQTAVASGPDWVRACLGWFAEDFIPPLPAYFDVPFQVAPTSAPLTVGASTTIQIQATGGMIFLCVQATDVIFNSGSSYQGTLRFVARNPGAAGNVSPSTILSGKIITGPAGLSMGPGTPALFTAGRDVETPAAAIKRCLGKWARLGAGWTLPAYDYLIPLAAPQVTRWWVDVANPFGPGTVGVWIADAAGPATDAERDAVAALLGSTAVRPLGSGGVTVQKASDVALAITVVVGTDGSNPNLVQNITDALNALAAAIIGPADFRGELLYGVIMGGAFNGTYEIPDGLGGVQTIELALPGFGGTAAIASAVTSPALGADGLLLSAGQVLALTLNISTVST